MVVPKQNTSKSKKSKDAMMDLLRIFSERRAGKREGGSCVNSWLDYIDSNLYVHADYCILID